MTSQDISFVLMLISSVSLLVIVGLIIFIGIGVVRLLGLFSEVNSVSQAMRLEVNKLLHKTASLSNAER